MQTSSSRTGLSLAIGLLLASGQIYAGQPLETEGARVLQKGTMEAGGSVEWQTSSDGQELALPFVFDYGITDRLELSLEPVIYSRIHPDAGSNSRGIGDLEATLKWVAVPETLHLPAFAIGAELKIPTARNSQIGTGKTDYRGFVAASRRIDKWDLHATAGYTALGKPAGVAIHNIFDYALAAEFHATDKIDWLAEITGQTSATNEGADGVSGTQSGENPIAPELAGSETVGMVGARYFWRPGAAFTMGVTYDNNNALSIRPGITIRW